MKHRQFIRNSLCAIISFSGAWIGLGTPVAIAGPKLNISDDTFIQIGAGIRVGYSGQITHAPGPDELRHNFALQNARLYVSGQITPQFKFTFNTERIWGKYGILDAIGQWEPHPAFNLWIGRMRTPADRIELNGPYYGLSWNQYTVPLFPSDWSQDFDTAGAYGRDEGVTIWGSVEKFQYALGIFDGYKGPATKKDPLLFAGRLSYNFLNKEQNPGYYTSSTYYGKAGDIFTLAIAGQFQRHGANYVDINDQNKAANFGALSADLFLEKVLRNGHVLNVEGEFKYFDCDCGPDRVKSPIFTLYDGKSAFGTAGFMFGNKVGVGYFQPYLRHTANFPDVGKGNHLSELGLNYVIDGHNLRLNANATYGEANASGYAATHPSTTLSFGAQFQI